MQRYYDLHILKIVVCHKMTVKSLEETTDLPKINSVCII